MWPFTGSKRFQKLEDRVSTLEQSCLSLKYQVDVNEASASLDTLKAYHAHLYDEFDDSRIYDGAPSDVSRPTGDGWQLLGAVKNSRGDKTTRYVWGRKKPAPAATKCPLAGGAA